MSRQRDPILEAQQRLAATLGEARASEDRELAKLVRELGERLARILHGLLRLTQLHAPDNKAFDGPVRDFQQVTRSLIDLLGPAHLVCVENQVYVNDLRLRFDANPEQPAALGQALERLNVGGITFNEPLSAPKIRVLVAILTAEPEPPYRRTAALRRLSDAGLHSLELHPPYQFLMEEEDIERDPAQVYRASAMVVAEALASMAVGRLPNPLPIRRVIHDLIDVSHAGKRDPAGIAWEVDAELPPFARHTIMVTNLSILLGRAARLKEATISDLGMAAMFHDAGLYLQELRQGDTAPDFERHAHTGIGVLLRQRGFHASRIRRLLAVLEHHRPHKGPARPSLFARIIHIVDDYDILTRPRPRTGPVSAPPDAIRSMAARSGEEYDPVLLQIFINAMGPFPPGSLLRLENGMVVISASGVRSPQTFAKPLCKVALLPDSDLPDDDQLHDLAEGGRIAEVVRPRKPT